MSDSELLALSSAEPNFFHIGSLRPQLLTKKKLEMKHNIIIAAMAVIATFVAGTERVNAQQSQTPAELVKNLTATLERMKQSQPLMKEAAQHTYFYDKSDLNLNFGDEKYSFTKKIRRNATSGVALGINAGAVQMAENFSPTAGLSLTMAWKRIEGSVGFSGAISQFNNESDKAGDSFISPIANADLGLIVTHFPLGKYDNMGYVSVGYSFMYVFDKNHNISGQNTYETPTETLITSDYFAVEGNSMAHCGYAKVRFALKHMGCTAVSVKAFGGVYNRYYQEGSRRKAIVGVSVSLEFSGAKKRVDNNVVELQSLLESYNVYQTNK